MEEEGWRFLYEALLRISSLRLLLTKDLVSPAVSCNRKLKASLRRFSSCLELVCEWEVEQDRECGKRTVRVPLPLCPLDHAAPLEVVAREDHIEVKIKLISGGAGFLLDQKFVPKISSSESSELALCGPDVVLRCRICKTAVTRGGFKISSVMDLPSIDWRDATDDWFGVCCCGSSIRTESIVAGFEKNVTPSHGKLLVGDSTCIVHARDLCQVDQLSTNTEVDSALTETIEEETGASKDFHRKEHAADHCHGDDCGNGHDDVLGVETTSKTTPSFYDFLKGPVEPSSSGVWKPLHCVDCSSLLGAFFDPKDENRTLQSAVHLFKRHILAGGKNAQAEPFRYQSLEKYFTKELLYRADENSTYRYVVRDLTLKKPMLQVVLISEKSLVYFGTVDSKTESSLGSFIPAASAMLQDCSEFQGHELEIVEEWCARHNVDDIFLLDEEISSLLRIIRANQEFFPASYSINQGFRLSFFTK